jgi:hypothetical protein
MQTTGGKLWFAVAALGTAGGLLYWFATGRGEWLGTMVLGSIVLASLLLGTTSAVLDDGNVDVFASAAEAVPVRRTLPAVWPPLAAVGIGLALIGLAGKSELLYVGIGILALIGVEWIISAWAERATGDHAANRSLRHTMMAPLETPLLAAVAIAFVVLSVSRVFLALPENGTIIAAGTIATLFLVVGSVVATRPQVTSSVLTALLAVGAVAILAGGIAGLSTGSREFEKHESKEQVDTTGNGDSPDATPPSDQINKVGQP